MLSIPSQIKELKEFADKLGLTIVKTFEESMSAKAPGRPKFAEMMAGLLNKEAEGILCWKLDRLARNPVDGGAITWTVKDKKTEIITPGHTYSYANEDTLLMYMEFGMAQKFIDDLGKSSQRGMRTKAEMGWYPAPAPLGYRNTPDRKKGFKIIEVDEEKFPLVKRLFTEIINGKQPCEVYREASQIWKLTSQRGTILCQSAFYNLITKSFYFGEYEWPKKSGNWYKSNHTPMITREEFNIVQMALGKMGKPVARKHTFDLTGLFRCSECGSAMTATQKVKYYSGTKRYATYNYYYCTRKNKKIKCHSKPLTESDVLKQIDDLLIKIKPDEEFVVWARKWLSAMHLIESNFQEETLKSQQKMLESIETKLNRLLDVFIAESIDEPTYKSKKAKFEEEKRAIQDKISNVGNTMEGWRAKVEDTLEFALACQHKFSTGTRAEKHEVLLRIGENLILKPNKLLDVKLKPEYGVLGNKQNWGSKYKGWLEPQNYTEIMDKDGTLRPSIPVWLPRVDSNREPSA